MGKEIERKFLVNIEALPALEELNYDEIAQAYVHALGEPVVRVRLKNQRAFLTLKGKNQGTTRSEFEYEIPVSDAHEMIELWSASVLRKRRYYFQQGSHTWEIDFFYGKLEGLILAELELQHEHEEVQLPAWIGKEVSTDRRYYNVNLLDIHDLRELD